MKNYIKIFTVVGFVLFLFFININNVFALEDGCTAYTKYSVTTGELCGNNVPKCSSISGYRLIKGASCAVDEKVPVVFNFKARDPDRDNLAWSMDWGDGSSFSKVCPAKEANTNLRISHGWSKSGIYNVKLGVSDCNSGDVAASFNVIVRSSNLSKNSDYSEDSGDQDKNNTGNDQSKRSTAVKGSLPVPQNVTGYPVSPSSILIKWDEIDWKGSGINGPAGYIIYRNGVSFYRALKGNTVIYDNILCGTYNVFDYKVEPYIYDENWVPISSGTFSDIVRVSHPCSTGYTTQVLSPNGGESYKIGENINITWRITGLTNNNNSVAVEVRKFRSDGNYKSESAVLGETWYNDYKENGLVLDTGHYDWKIPDSVSPGEYIIQVLGGPMSISGQDISDGSFTIKSK